MSTPLLAMDRICGAPISWGVCEAEPWGLQLDAGLVLDQMESLGLQASELGPAGFLGQGPIEVAARLASHRMRMVGGFVPVPFHCATAEDLAQVREEINVLVECGADVVVFAARSTDGSYDHKVTLTEAEWEQFKITLDALAREVTARGLTPTLHPHVGTAIESATMVQRLINETAIALTVDTGHLLIGGTDPVALVQAHPERVAHVHLKDVNTAISARVQAGEITYLEGVKQGMYVALGRGNVDIAGVVRSLEASGYRGWYVMEQDCALSAAPVPGEPGPIDDVKASIAFLVA